MCHRLGRNKLPPRGDAPGPREVKEEKTKHWGSILKSEPEIEICCKALGHGGSAFRSRPSGGLSNSKWPTDWMDTSTEDSGFGDRPASTVHLSIMIRDGDGGNNRWQLQVEIRGNRCDSYPLSGLLAVTGMRLMEAPQLRS